MLKKVCSIIAMLTVAASAAMAQVTTSGMSGKVTGDNEEIIGAHIQAVHTPSGTKYVAVTNINGRYSIQGMRPGGPYEVTISYIGYETKTVKNVTLVLGETYNLNEDMSETSNQLTDVVITGSASKFSNEKMGTSTNISSEQMTNIPTVSRHITDLIRLSPYGGNGMSLAGRDGRMGNYTVDGANFNNNFGLTDNLPGGGNPISMDAIEELQVVIAPYDVRQTNFIGGSVNAITKSGTNTFKGSAYVYHRNENMRGDAIDREQLTGVRTKDQETTYGFTFGGPILKNKLYFFANAEMIISPTVVNRWRASEDGVADATSYQSRTTVADMQKVSDFVRQQYGYDTGSFTHFPADNDNYKLLIRADWNITDKHKLAVRYNYTKNQIWKKTNDMSMDGGARGAHARFSDYAMGFANSVYSQDNIVHSFSIDLNSRLTDDLFNQLLITYSKMDDMRGSESSNFPFIDILDGNGDNYISLGHELFSWNSGVHNKVWSIKDDMTYYLGKHKIMGGLYFEYQMADNAYQRNGTGYYRYRSLDDFLNSGTPEIVALTYGYGGNMNPAARIQYNKLGFYAQDEWNIDDKWKITFGTRIDGFLFNNKDLMTNNAILAINYNGKHLDTGKWPSNNLVLSPRLGFSYDVYGDKTLKVRGGTGLFAGRLPLVFLTNMPNNSNMLQFRGVWNATGNKATQANMDQFSGKIMNSKELYDYISTHDVQGNLYTDPQTQTVLGPATISPEEGTIGSTISGVDAKFKMPQIWKTSIAVDYKIPVSFPFTVTVEGIFNKMLNDVCIKDWSIKNVAEFDRFKGADSRPIYQNYQQSYTNANGVETPTPNAFVLSNTSKGHGWTINITLDAKPFDWLSLLAAYTHTITKEVSGMPGNDASSAYSSIPTVDGPNYPQLHNSAYLTPDRFLVSASIHDRSGNHYNLIYEASNGGSGYNYSAGLTNDMNGDGYKYDLIYIPTDKEVADREFRFKTADDQQRFMDFVHNNDYFKNHQGEYAEAFGMHAPWVHTLDFGYKHDFKFRVAKQHHMLQLCFDVKNVLNFFDSSWGVHKYVNPEISGTDYFARVLKYEGKDADGYATFSTPAAINGSTQLWIPYHHIDQCWYASFGVRYTF
ncbi:MAG: TonB-dependent receptor [Bacteroidaceae bacterium]|nr:TonB-dependent receptor [Bacteroidaceae bacterium]